MQDNCPSTDPVNLTDLNDGAPASASAGEVALQEAQRLFNRTLQSWAMDVLRLRAMGIDRPRGGNCFAMAGGPAAPPREPELARDVRHAA